MRWGRSADESENEEDSPSEPGRPLPKASRLFFAEEFGVRIHLDHAPSLCDLSLSCCRPEPRSLYGLHLAHGAT